MISDIKHNLQARLALPDAVKPVCVQGSARADDGCNGGYRPDACGAESWNRFRIAATAGHCYYRRSDRGYFLRFVCFPLIVEIVYGKMLYDKDGRLKQKNYKTYICAFFKF